MNLDYDPNAMFPKKRERKKEKFLTNERVMRFLVIVGLALLVLFIGAGCGSVRNVKEIDLSITGLEMEFYPEHPSQEDKGFFGAITNRVVPGPIVVPASYRELMPMTRDR